MELPDIHIEKLKQEIIATLGRTIDSPTDFDYLSIKIAEKTGDSISVSTLKRLFGYVKGAGTPRPSTLSSLARYVGYSGWSEFCAAHTVAAEASAPPVDAHHRTTKIKRRLAPWAIAITIAALVIIAFMAWPRGRATTASKTDTISKVDTPTPTPTTVEPQVAIEPRVVTKAQGATTTPLSNTDKYEKILIFCLKESNKMCNRVRDQGKEMDGHEYVKLADSNYYPFVFTELKQIIQAQVSAAFPGEPKLQQRYANDVFIQCREVCLVLLREAYQRAMH